MKTTVNIIPSSTNTVSIQEGTNKIVVTDNSENTSVEVNQQVTSVVQVLTGAQGSRGDQGLVGPSGSSANINTGSLVTTSSFNSFTSSYSTGSFTGSFTGSILAGTLITTGNTSLASVQENLVLIDGTPSPSHSFDFNSGSIFYLTGQTQNTVWNVINLPTTAEKATTLTFIIEQENTAFSASAYQFNGTSVSVKWPQGVVPTGSASTTDAIGLTAFRLGSTWTVLGSLAPFV
jgi:hypothetical protein